MAGIICTGVDDERRPAAPQSPQWLAASTGPVINRPLDKSGR